MITGTQLAYYKICIRKLWLFSHGIVMEQENDKVLEGSNLHEYSYERLKKELEIFGCVVDSYNHKEKIVYETKLSKAMSETHIMQLKYYLYLFKSKGGIEATGVINYPKTRRKETVTLTTQDEADIEAALSDIKNIVGNKTPDKVQDMAICKSCAYFEYCFA